MGIRRRIALSGIGVLKAKDELPSSDDMAEAIIEKDNADDIAIKVLLYRDKTHLSPDEAEILAREYLLFRLAQETRSPNEAKKHGNNS